MHPSSSPPRSVTYADTRFEQTQQFAKQFQLFRRKRGRQGARDESPSGSINDDRRASDPGPKDQLGTAASSSSEPPSEPPSRTDRTQSDTATLGLAEVNSINRQLTTTSIFSYRDKRAGGSEAPEQDPVGLKILHRPDGGNDRKVDIVFVHGLGGSSRMTWSKNRDLEYFWPLKFLPLEPEIKEARILTFGYNANFKPGSGKNKMSVLDFAKDLLYDLKYAKDEDSPDLEDLRMGEVSYPGCFSSPG